MPFALLGFLLGLPLLLKGADLLVDGGSSLAKRLGISSLVIGLTVVAFGTSMPELLTNIFASLSGATDIAIGNVVGSNIANILLVLGAAAVIFPLSVTKGTVWKEIPFALLAVVVLAFMANDMLLEGKLASEIGFIDGWVLLAFFGVFFAYVLAISKNGNGHAEQNGIQQMSLKKAVIFCVLGIAGLAVGGKFVVDGAVAFAAMFHVSQALIGLTIVAVGTSLPELLTSVVAARKKNSDIAIGNVVGSNIFNVFWILGISAIIKPLPFSPVLNVDIAMVLLATFLLFIVMFIGKRHTLEKWQGAAFLVLYGLYIGYLIFRG
ncbi:MAG TPA: calcium/sodium antiporter [Candidatus Paceibacterota bacterium]|nr:calcium/sodium antiporter [Candidatus Paceibacterota bacterium]